MDGEYRFANLSEEDRRRLSALEDDLARKYGRDVVIIAYEKDRSGVGSARMEVGRLGVDSQERGTTFGYGDAHFDAYPTLADVMDPEGPGTGGTGGTGEATDRDGTGGADSAVTDRARRRQRPRRSRS